MALPAHVVGIEPGHVILGGDLSRLLPVLKASGHADRVFRDPQLRLCLRRSAALNPLADPELAGLLGWLAGAGVVFLERLDQPYGPAELMRALQAMGSVGAFSSLIVRGGDDFEVVQH